MFWTRLKSSIVLMIIAIAALYFGGYVLFGVLLGISLIGLMELYRVFGLNKKLPAVIGYFATLVYYAGVLFRIKENIIIILLCFLLVLMVIYVIFYPKYNFTEMAITFFGFFYVAVMLSYIYQVRRLDYGIYSVWLIFIGGWGSDTCAYIAGNLFGKHKFTPLLSPKKTIEGCIGGVIGAALIGFIFGMVFKDKFPHINSPQLACAIVGAACSMISQIGDLAASAIKRQNGIKDYGKLIPGHGGILDRFDSIIFTAPICFILIILF